MTFSQSMATRTICFLLAFAAVSSIAMAQVVPEPINHQGYIEVDGQPFDGNGAFRFAIVDGGGNNLWTHDGSELATTNMPGSPLALSVVDGVYSVALGDGTTTDPFAGGLFAGNDNLALRVWFDDGTNGVQQLTPDKPLRHVPYANVAKTADIAAETQSVPDVITVDRVEYSTPRTHYLMVAAEDFIPNAEDDNYRMGPTGVTSATGNVLFTAAVDFPDGARVTEMTFIYEDGDANSEVEVQLQRTDPFTGQNILVEDAISDPGGTDGEGEDSVSVSANFTVDNSQYLYRLIAFDEDQDWGNFDMYLRAVRFKYELDAAQ